MGVFLRYPIVFYSRIKLYQIHTKANRPVGIEVTTSLPVREVGGFILGLVKSDSASPTGRHRLQCFFEV